MANATTLSGTSLSTPTSPEPSLCRVSGYLKDIHGKPLVGTFLRIRHKYSPLAIVSTSLILQERMTVRSGRNGLIEFDLLRESRVDVEIPNLLQEVVLHCVVPNSASANLIDFLFPHLVDVQWVTASPLSLAVGESAEVEVKGILSNGQEVSLTSVSVDVETSDPAVVVESPGDLYYRGVAPGSATLDILSVDSDPLKLNLKPNGDPIILFSVPPPTLPGPLTVNVS